MRLSALPPEGTLGLPMARGTDHPPSEEASGAAPRQRPSTRSLPQPRLFPFPLLRHQSDAKHGVMSQPTSAVEMHPASGAEPIAPVTSIGSALARLGGGGWDGGSALESRPASGGERTAGAAGSRSALPRLSGGGPPHLQAWDDATAQEMRPASAAEPGTGDG